MTKKWVGILFFALLGGYLSQQYTEGFTIAKISTQLLDQGTSSIDETLLMQPYRYLTKGGQSYVFLSEDGHYILKLSRCSRMQNARLLSTLFPISKFHEKINKEKCLLEKTLKSHAIAYDHLRDETGLVAVHLGRDPTIEHPLMIIDKLGITHKIDPNNYPFIIQKKVVGVREKIQKLMANNDQIRAEKHLRSLFSLLLHRKEKGLEDEDPNLVKNFGFNNEVPIQIDTGRFTYSLGDGESRVADSKEDLQHWINAHYPSLSETFDLAYKDYQNGTL